MALEDDFAIFSKILEPVLREPLVLDRKYISPIPRANGEYERSPSFKVFEGNGKYADMLWFRDWGMTDQQGNRPVHLIMYLHNVDKETAEGMLDSLDLPEIPEIRRQRKNKLRIEDRPEYTKQELAWWASYNVSKDTLEHFNVRGVDRLYAGQNLLYETGIGKPAFSYRGGDELELWEFYQPKTYAQKKDFWRSGHFVMGMAQLPYVMDDLILGAGGKDNMCTHEASDIPTLALGSEGAWKVVEKILPTLKRRAKRIWTLMNPDAPGVVATRKFMQELAIPPYPFKFLDTKRDIADLSRTMGMKWLTRRFEEAKNRIPYDTTENKI